MKGYTVNVLAMILMGSLSVQAQQTKSTDGLYVKVDDFKNQIVKDQLGSGDRLLTNSLFGGSQIKLQRNGQTTKVAKDDLYGYRIKDKDYRLYKNGEYEIADTAGFYLYKRKELTAGRKGQVPQTIYYFSKTPTGDLVRLTIGNLNQQYQDQADFRYALMNSFKNDAQLTNYDAQLKTYQLKYVYLQHSKAALSK